MTAAFQNDLQARFNQPALWVWRDRIETRPGQHIRGGWAIPENPKGLVVMLPGLSEYIEKYFEVFNDLLARGYAVASLDWRGQGKSWRHADLPGRRLHDDFDLDRIDAQTFITMIPLPLSVPRIMLAHSMGAHTGLRLLKSTRDHFCCAVMTAPMFGINLPGYADPLVRLLVLAAARCGLRHTPLPGGEDWTETLFHNNIKLLTSDPERAAMQFYWMTRYPELRMGTLTFSWLEQALNSIKLTSRPEWLADIDTPCLIVQSGKERIVSNAAIQRTSGLLKRAQVIEIPGARHEVTMERDVYRKVFWQAFDGHVAKYL